MVERAFWFTRVFSFEHLPVWMYPNVVERLRGTPARLEDLTRAVPPEVLTRRDGDKWSMQEHAGHLLDLEQLETVWKLLDLPRTRKMALRPVGTVEFRQVVYGLH